VGYDISPLKRVKFEILTTSRQGNWTLFQNPSKLPIWQHVILGGSVISSGTIHDLRQVKVPGNGPLWNPCTGYCNDFLHCEFIQSSIYTGFCFIAVCACGK
jgi:hypothetical protein